MGSYSLSASHRQLILCPTGRMGWVSHVTPFLCIIQQLPLDHICVAPVNCSGQVIRFAKCHKTKQARKLFNGLNWRRLWQMKLRWKETWRNPTVPSKLQEICAVWLWGALFPGFLVGGRGGDRHTLAGQASIGMGEVIPPSQCISLLSLQKTGYPLPFQKTFLDEVDCLSLSLAWFFSYYSLSSPCLVLLLTCFLS